MLPQWHLKDPDHSAKSAGGGLQLNTHTPTLDPTKSEWASYAVEARVRTYRGNELTHVQLGNTRAQSSQLAEPLWTDLGLKSRIDVCELICTTKKKKKRRRGMNRRTFPPDPRKRGKSHHHD